MDLKDDAIYDYPSRPPTPSVVDEPKEGPTVFEPTPTPPPLTPRRDTSFYLEPVVFQVGNTLFKVSKTGFQVPGTPFEAMFALPAAAGPGGSVEGSSDDNPIHLHGVDENKFKAFLTVLYPSICQPDPEHQYATLVGALDLATFWEFTKLRGEIIASFAPMIRERDALEVIHIATKYRVADWLRQALLKLIHTTMYLSMAELSSDQFPLDWEIRAKICHARDVVARDAAENTECGSCGQGYGPGYPGPNRFSCECRVVKIINAHFKRELDDAGEGLLYLSVPATLWGLPAEGPRGKKKKGTKK